MTFQLHTSSFVKSYSRIFLWIIDFIFPTLNTRVSGHVYTYFVADEDVLYGAISSEEEKVESDDGLPQIGRQKKPDSDSDFQVDEESGSDWEQASKVSDKC